MLQEQQHPQQHPQHKIPSTITSIRKFRSISAKWLPTISKQESWSNWRESTIKKNINKHSKKGKKHPRQKWREKEGGEQTKKTRRENRKRKLETREENVVVAVSPFHYLECNVTRTVFEEEVFLPKYHTFSSNVIKEEDAARRETVWKRRKNVITKKIAKWWKTPFDGPGQMDSGRSIVCLRGHRVAPKKQLKWRTKNSWLVAILFVIRREERGSVEVTPEKLPEWRRRRRSIDNNNNNWLIIRDR